MCLILHVSGGLACFIAIDGYWCLLLLYAIFCMLEVYSKVVCPKLSVQVCMCIFLMQNMLYAKLEHA